MSTDSEPIESYLDELYEQLRSEPRTARRLLAETEAHLHDRAEALVAQGRDRHDAELEAVRAFGPAAAIAAQHDVPVPLRFARLTQSLALLGAVGLIAIGVSGGVAAAMNALFGRAFVGNLHEAYPLTACRHFLAVQQGAHTCGTAAILENSADAVSLRLLAGVAGLVLLAAVLVWRRIRPRHTAPLSPALAGTVFGLGALALIGHSLDLLVVQGSNGVGFFLSGGIVAAVLALFYFGEWCVRTRVVRFSAPLRR